MLFLLLSFKLFGWDILIYITSFIGDYPSALIRGVKISKKLRKAGFPIYIHKNVIIKYPENIVIGGNVNIFDNAFLDAGKDGYIAIGSNTHIGVGSVIFGLGGVEIGEYVGISSNVNIYSQTNIYGNEKDIMLLLPIRKARVIIEDNVIIGANSVVLPSVRIRTGTFIGANSLVNKNTKPYSVYAGSPIRLIKVIKNKNITKQK